MADEAHVTQKLLLVSRASTSVADSQIRVTGKYILTSRSTYNIEDVQVRFSTKSIHLVVGGDLGIRATTKWLLGVVSANRVMLPSLLGSGGIFETFEFDLETQFFEIPEINPYRPTVPEEYQEMHPILYSFQREMQEVLRLQHNITQVGDTTYHWAYLVRIGPEQLWKLGSLGRFYHEDYGVIIARYCKFKNVLGDLQSHAPVGWYEYPRGRKSDFRWEVTNDPTKSRPTWAVGIAASFERLQDDYFGWVITEGQNLTSIPYTGATPVIKGQQLIWGSNHSLTDTGSGRVIAEFWKDEGVPGAELGNLYIHTSGFNDGYYSALLDGDLSAFQEELDQLQAAVEELLGLVADSGGTLVSLQAQITALQTALAREASIRAADDRRLRSDMNAGLATKASNADLAALENELRVLIETTKNYLLGLIAQAQATADEALAAVNALNLEAIQAQFELINASIIDIYARLKAQVPVLPMTDGSTPPVFFVDDDGNLMYTEIM